MKVGKARVEPPTIGNGIAAVTPNHNTTSTTECSWQSDLFLCIASWHKSECLTGGTIAPANLLPQAKIILAVKYLNRHYLSVILGQSSGSRTKLGQSCNSRTKLITYIRTKLRFALLRSTLAAIRGFRGKRSDVHLQDLTDIDFSLIPRPTVI